MQNTGSVFQLKSDRTIVCRTGRTNQCALKHDSFMTVHLLVTLADGRRKGGREDLSPPLDFDMCHFPIAIFTKKSFSTFERKNQISSSLLTFGPLEKSFWLPMEKSTVGPSIKILPTAMPGPCERRKMQARKHSVSVQAGPQPRGEFGGSPPRILLCSKICFKYIIKSKIFPP